jgi:hypothetical protein
MAPVTELYSCNRRSMGMSDRSLNVDKTRRPRNSLLAVGLLVAIIAVLVGFHGVTMVLSAITLSAGADATEKVSAIAPRHEAALPPVKSSEAPPAAVPVPNPTGVAAAAKAKAQAEMSERQDLQSEPEDRPRRSFRPPRVEMHKVY